MWNFSKSSKMQLEIWRGLYPTHFPFFFLLLLCPGYFFITFVAMENAQTVFIVLNTRHRNERNIIKDLLRCKRWPPTKQLHTYFPFRQDAFFNLLRWMRIRCLLRFEYQLPHPILCKTLVTDKKWSFSYFHISYQNSKISWQKMGTILNQKSAWDAVKIVVFKKKMRLKIFNLVAHFLLQAFFENLNF